MSLSAFNSFNEKHIGDNKYGKENEVKNLDRTFQK